ncbi:hypothetical protein QH73_0007085 [Scytonema millei VB511283]|uniref:Uncharacterized protein n=1 Tax=Scytonema millei VB511283 TaxID=1245923 RepID=A0A9X5I4C7_9CYAN|nr:hypothetical protein [Scytonema millei VB511283]
MKNYQEFSLFAPYNNAVNLIGAFSNWQEIPMNKGEDGYFRTQVELEDGIRGYTDKTRRRGLIALVGAHSCAPPYSCAPLLAASFTVNSICSEAENSCCWGRGR